MKNKANNDKIPDSELLALLRTLFALERNYLAEERTFLAKFRTGVALALFVTSLYIYSIALNWVLNLHLMIFFYSFLIICAVEGARLIIIAWFELKRCRRLKNLVTLRERKIINSSEMISVTFVNLINTQKNLNGIMNKMKIVTKLNRNEKK